MDVGGRVAEEVRRYTVQILANRQGSSGSGVLLNDGRILTNAHVATASSMSVRLWSGETLEGGVTRRDTRRDLALLQLKRSSSDNGVLREAPAVPGEVVMAVGNPFGFVGALSFGVVHAAGPHWIQAAVRLAPGNSGGPLADSHGQIIGINTMIYQGVGLAIPTAAVQRFLSRTADPPRLGITVRPVPAGLLVLEVEKDGAADRASILAGDIIVDLGPPRIKFLRGGSPRVRETVV